MTEEEFVGVLEGIVKWFSYRKGFGHITTKINGVDQDVFVHYAAIPGQPGEKKLHTDERVTMEVYKHTSSEHLGQYFTKKILLAVRMQ